MFIFRIHWFGGGPSEIIRGNDIVDAMNHTIHGAGALAIVDHYESFTEADLIQCSCGCETPRGEWGSVVYCRGCGALL